MKTMKCDMGGAATVLGTIVAIARLKLPVSVTGYMGLVENMVSGDSYKLGDVLTARNGKTIEVHNTDAEGRLVLADTLDVAVEQGVTRIIDLATLTGACLVALGMDVTGIMTNDQAWCDRAGGRRPQDRRTALATPHVRGVRRADPQRCGRHQERGRRTLGRRDHRRQVPGTVCGRSTLDPLRYRRPLVRRETQSLARRRRHRSHAPHAGRAGAAILYRWLVVDG